MQIHSEEEQAEQKEIQNGEFEEKKNTRKFNVRDKACAERDKKKIKGSEALRIKLIQSIL